jgi:ribosome-associated translation inhibitor RaiA
MTGETRTMSLRHHVVTKRVDLTDYLRRQLEERLQRLQRRLRHFPPEALQAQVAVERQARGGAYVVRLALSIWGHTLVARRLGPTLEVALDEATAAIERQVERYKARLRGDYLHERKRAALSPEERAARERELIEDRALLDRALLGDRQAFDELTERELPGLTRFIRRQLTQRGVDGAALDTLLPQLLEQTLLMGFEELRHKPEPMTLQGWLARQARPLIERAASYRAT